MFHPLTASSRRPPKLSKHIDYFFGSTAQAKFEPEASHLFWQCEDVVSLGQFVSTYVDITGPPKYKSRVLVLTGEEDQAFCALGSPVLGPAKCGDLLPDTQTLFPNDEGAVGVALMRGDMRSISTTRHPVHTMLRMSS